MFNYQRVPACWSGIVGECLLVDVCCVVHDYWRILFLLVHILVLAFYSLHINVNVKVLVCLLFLYVLICVCVLAHACLCVHGIRMW